MTTLEQYARVTAAQARKWALYGRTPNDWALEHLIGRTEHAVVGATGRQVGKTDEIADFLDEGMRRDPRPNDNKPENPPDVGVLAPTFDKSEKSVFRYAENLARVFGTDSFTMNQNRHILTIKNPAAGKVGARLRWFSAEDTLGVVGNTLSDYAIDEAQDVPDEVYNRFIPTQDVRDAHGAIFGTPDIMVDQTWFQGLWDAGQDPLDLDVHSFTIASWEAPWMNIDMILRAKQSLPTNDFRRLYGGEWVNTAGLVFTGYELALMAEEMPWKAERRPIMAVDLAIQNDFNVIMLGDPITKTIFHRERWNLTDPLDTYDRILSVHEQFGKPKVYVDATGMGRIPARELASHLGTGMIVPVEWSSGEHARYNKMDAIRGLAGDLQHRKIMFPAAWDDVRREMKSFVYGRSPSGKLTAAARTGAHDDLVMTMAMLNLGFRRVSGSGSTQRHNYLNGAADPLQELQRGRIFR